MIRREDLWPLGAVAFLLIATAAWWALALWPLPSDAPVWLERARSVCFNTTETGLPDVSGWILLIGQPAGMVGLLLAGWRADVRRSLRHLTTTRSGLLLVAVAVMLVLGGFGATGVRVLSARIPDPMLAGGEDVPDTYPRLDMAWPEMPDLVDQRGMPFTGNALQGRRALVTFAYAHCATICPLVVHSARTTRSALAREGIDARIVVFTLDPWRDTPSSLRAIAEQWELSDTDFVVSGDVASVEAALDAWKMSRVRDERTGDITHPALTYLVEADGTVAYASTGAAAQILALARRMR